jgi:hypothetical protein
MQATVETVKAEHVTVHQEIEARTPVYTLHDLEVGVECIGTMALNAIDRNYGVVNKENCEHWLVSAYLCKVAGNNVYRWYETRSGEVLLYDRRNMLLNLSCRDEATRWIQDHPASFMN